MGSIPVRDSEDFSSTKRSCKTFASHFMKLLTLLDVSECDSSSILLQISMNVWRIHLVVKTKNVRTTKVFMCVDVHLDSLRKRTHAKV